MGTPSASELTEAFAAAAREAIEALLDETDEDFYYLALHVDEEAKAAHLTGWSHEALDLAVLDSGDDDDDEVRADLRWSYSESPYVDYGAAYFADANALLAAHHAATAELAESKPAAWQSAREERLDALVEALVRIDEDGLFGEGDDRMGLYLNVEVHPEEDGNVARARQLNPRAARRIDAGRPGDPNMLAEWMRRAEEGGGEDYGDYDDDFDDDDDDYGEVEDGDDDEYEE